MSLMGRDILTLQIFLRGVPLIMSSFCSSPVDLNFCDFFKRSLDFQNFFRESEDFPCNRLTAGH